MPTTRGGWHTLFEPLPPAPPLPTRSACLPACLPTCPAAAAAAPACAGEADAEWEEYLNQGWDRQRAAGIAAGLPELELQRDSEQRPHKISYKLK